MFILFFKFAICIFVLKGEGGGGGGVHPIFFVELYFDIAVDQQTKAHDRTFEGVPDSGCPRDNHALIWSILANHLNMFKTMRWGVLIVANSLLNT